MRVLRGRRNWVAEPHRARAAAEASAGAPDVAGGGSRDRDNPGPAGPAGRPPLLTAAHRSGDKRQTFVCLSSPPTMSRTLHAPRADNRLPQAPRRGRPALRDPGLSRDVDPRHRPGGADASGVGLLPLRHQGPPARRRLRGGGASHLGARAGGDSRQARRRGSGSKPPASRISRPCSRKPVTRRSSSACGRPTCPRLPRNSSSFATRTSDCSPSSSTRCPWAAASTGAACG